MKKALFIFGGLALIGASAYAYFKRQAKLLSEFTYRIRGFNVKQLSAERISATVQIDFTSASSIEATVEHLYMDIHSNGKRIGFITDVAPFIIPAKGTSTIDILFSLDPGDLFANAVAILTGAVENRDLIVTLSGYARVKSGFVAARIPIDYTTGLKQYFS